MTNNQILNSGAALVFLLIAFSVFFGNNISAASLLIIQAGISGLKARFG